MSRWRVHFWLLFISTFVLTVAVPPGLPKPSHRSFPFLSSLLRAREAVAALAEPRPATPVQPHGGGHGDGVASTADTAANGGNGRAPTKTPGALEEAAPVGVQSRPDWTAP